MQGEDALLVWLSCSPIMFCFAPVFVRTMLAPFYIGYNSGTVFFGVNPAKITSFKTSGEFVDRDDLHAIPYRLQTGGFIAVKYAHFPDGLNLQKAGSVVVNYRIAPCGFFRRPSGADSSFGLLLCGTCIVHTENLLKMRLTVRRIF